MTITFEGSGTYTYDSISVVCQPMDRFSEQIAALGANPMTDVAFETNKITGDISMSEDGLLFMSLPYSEGWQATVDGEKAEVLQADVAYSAIRLKEGNHHVVLTYTTPWYKAGLICTILATMGFICLVVFTERRKRHAADLGGTLL